MQKQDSMNAIALLDIVNGAVAGIGYWHVLVTPVLGSGDRRRAVEFKIEIVRKSKVERDLGILEQSYEWQIAKPLTVVHTVSDDVSTFQFEADVVDGRRCGIRTNPA